MRFALACPACRNPLTTLDTEADVETYGCAACPATYRVADGVGDFLVPERREPVDAFVARYSAVRLAEGRRALSAPELQALPFRDLTRRHDYEWFIRARSFLVLLRRVIRPLERGLKTRLRILDLGSGVGWLAHRLALRGHRVAAVDLVAGDAGLGAHAKYPSRFLSLRADFDRLPFVDESFDVVVYNAAFHYAASYSDALREALRVLRHGGSIVVMDSPIYRRHSSGVAMVRERGEAFERTHGFRGDEAPGEGFLTPEMLTQLGRDLSLEWTIHEAWYGLRWRLKPLLAIVRRDREPARFKLLVARSREAP